MKKIPQEIQLNIQLSIAVVVFITGIGLLVAGFVIPPSGEIHNSVLVAFGECCTFCGSIIGVDYHYRFKSYEEQERRKHHNHQELVEDEDN